MTTYALCRRFAAYFVRVCWRLDKVKHVASAGYKISARTSWNIWPIIQCRSKFMVDSARRVGAQGSFSRLDPDVYRTWLSKSGASLCQEENTNVIKVVGEVGSYLHESGFP